MIVLDKNLRELKETIVALLMTCNKFKMDTYPNEYKTYEEAWEELFLSFDYLQNKLGDERYEQVVDMAKQAKAHYESEEIHWGSWLMQDIRQVVGNKLPFAYPEDMYRWPKLRLVK